MFGLFIALLYLLALPSLAAEERHIGPGTIGVIDPAEDVDRMLVTLPAEEARDAFDFILDPERLIVQSDAQRYEGCTFLPAEGVYFRTDEQTYSGQSKKFQIANAGTVDVDVRISVKATGGNVELVPKAEVSSGTGRHLYLGLVIEGDSAQQASIVQEITAEEKVVTLPLRGSKSESDLPWSGFSFYIEGAADLHGDWGEDVVTPEFQITWSYGDAYELLAASEDGAAEGAVTSDVTEELTQPLGTAEVSDVTEPLPGTEIQWPTAAPGTEDTAHGTDETAGDLPEGPDDRYETGTEDAITWLTPDDVAGDRDEPDPGPEDEEPDSGEPEDTEPEDSSGIHWLTPSRGEEDDKESAAEPGPEAPEPDEQETDPPVEKDTSGISWLTPNAGRPEDAQPEETASEQEPEEDPGQTADKGETEGSQETEAVKKAVQELETDVQPEDEPSGAEEQPETQGMPANGEPGAV